MLNVNKNPTQIKAYNNDKSHDKINAESLVQLRGATNLYTSLCLTKHHAMKMYGGVEA
jgi:hypothetical protein